MIQTKKYSVGNMDCGSCAISIEMLLANQPGVRSAKVSFDEEEAVIEFEDQGFHLDSIKKLTQQIGYTLTEK